MVKISYSQYSTWKQCPWKFKLSYIDNNRIFAPNIHLIFGSSIHLTLQKYLSIFYMTNEKKANELNMFKFLKEAMISEYNKYLKKGHIDFTTLDEFNEFYADGVEIINFFKKRRADYFPKKDHVLIGCEVPINYKLKDELVFNGYLDVVIKNIKTHRIKIIDFKKSYSGWRPKAANDKVKRSQLQMYKIFYSKEFNIPINNIDVEFLILKQKVYETPMGFPGKRIQRVVPPTGKITMNVVNKNINEFVDIIFDDGVYNKDSEYIKNPDINICKWCPYNLRPDLCQK